MPATAPIELLVRTRMLLVMALRVPTALPDDQTYLPADEIHSAERTVLIGIRL